MIITIDLPDGTSPVYRAATQLGGYVWVFTFRYSFRTKGWHVDLDDYVSSQRRVTGARLRVGVNILSEVPDGGLLEIISVDGSTADPQLTDFAEGKFAFYWQAEGKPFQ